VVREVNMSRARDYVPSNAAQFNAFMHNLIDNVKSKKTEWTNIPKERLTELVEMYVIFETAFQATMGAHTAAQTIAQQKAQAECTRVLRAFVNQFIGADSAVIRNAHFHTANMG